MHYIIISHRQSEIVYRKIFQKKEQLGQQEHHEQHERAPSVPSISSGFQINMPQPALGDYEIALKLRYESDDIFLSGDIEEASIATASTSGYPPPQPFHPPLHIEPGHPLLRGAPQGQSAPVLPPPPINSSEEHPLAFSHPAPDIGYTAHESTDGKIILDINMSSHES
jgi:hypothetical protein